MGEYTKLPTLGLAQKVPKGRAAVVFRASWLGKASLGVSLRDAVCGWKCAVEKRSGFRYNQINESA